jgi:hypothetical protein
VVNVARETLRAIHELGALHVEEVPVSLEDAFVSYLGGTLEGVGPAQVPELAPMLGGLS